MTQENEFSDKRLIYALPDTSNYYVKVRKTTADGRVYEFYTTQRKAFRFINVNLYKYKHKYELV